jgi:hypothetical protein
MTESAVLSAPSTLFSIKLILSGLECCATGMEMVVLKEIVKHWRPKTGRLSAAGIVRN